MKTKAASSILVEEIGLDSTLRLSRRFPVERAPVLNMGLTTNRDARERRAFILAHPQRNAVELARESGLTTRRILQIRAAARQGAGRIERKAPFQIWSRPDVGDQDDELDEKWRGVVNRMRR